MNDLDFINREQVIKYITLDSFVKYILIVAPFGYGKTWLIQKIANLFKKEKYKYISINLKENIDLKIVEKEFENIKESEKIFISFENVDLETKDNVEYLINKKIKPLDIEDLKVVLSSRNINIINTLKLEVYITDIKIEPFNINIISEMVEKYLIKHKIYYNNHLKFTLSHYLLYHTGGCPNCIANILPYIDYKDIDNYFRENIKIKNIININAKKVIEDLHLDIKTILPLLSPIRKFNRKTLRYLINHGILNYDRNLFELEERLISSKIIERKGSLLQDDITRKLLAIDFRNRDKDLYLKVISFSKKSYIELIDNTNLPYIFAIEFIFLTLEEKLLTNIEGTYQEIKDVFSFSFINFLEKSKNDIEETKILFHEALLEDRELEAMVNYYLGRRKEEFSKDEYYKIIGEIFNGK